MRELSVALIFFGFMCGVSFNIQAQTKPIIDTIEQATGLKKVQGDRFIIDMKYNSDDNFLKKNVYSEFGLDSCYVHKEVYEKLDALSDILKERQLKLVVFDCYRPLEVQKVMWKILPDARYVANPKNGSLHNRGVAIDCALADENGVYLEFPTAFDTFDRKSWLSYVCPIDKSQPCNNREMLKELMQKVGLFPINSEWWHFQLPNPKKYPII